MQTNKQKLLAKFYPIILFFGRVFGAKGKSNTNNNAIAIEALPWASIELNNGKKLEQQQWQNKTVLIANTASNCGYTAQYAELQQLQNNFKNLLVIAFPANDFKQQEPADDNAIETFCTINYSVQFPIAKKTTVLGNNAHPVFNWLSNPNLNGWSAQAPTWNFCKYLINPQGQLIGFFESGVSPLDKKITSLL